MRRSALERWATPLWLVFWVTAFGTTGGPVFAWGDEGHQVVALIAEHYLTPQVRARVDALLQADDSALTARDMAHEAVWADRYRDSDRDGSRRRYYATREWHFVDLELSDPDLYRACHGSAISPRERPASRGRENDCVVDKIEEFRIELASARTDPRERLFALQFLLHLVGDLHQPLHAADDHDQGGNREMVSAASIGSGSLHHEWDTEFVARLGPDASDTAARLIGRITEASRRQWSRGTPIDWALETFSVARTHAYGLLPEPQAPHRYRLPESYVVDAVETTAQQLCKAGVRLALILNQALG